MISGNSYYSEHFEDVDVDMNGKTFMFCSFINCRIIWDEKSVVKTSYCMFNYCKPEGLVFKILNVSGMVKPLVDLTEDMTIYVDTSINNDDGDGSFEQPYKSLSQDVLRHYFLNGHTLTVIDKQSTKR
jgi:hypothetical protein